MSATAMGDALTKAIGEMPEVEHQKPSPKQPKIKASKVQQEMVKKAFSLLSDKFVICPGFGIQINSSDDQITIGNKAEGVHISFPVDRFLVETKDGASQVVLHSTSKKLETCEDGNGLSIVVPIDQATSKPLVQQMKVSFKGESREKLRSFLGSIISGEEQQELDFSDWLDVNFNSSTIKAHKIGQKAFVGNDPHLIVGTTYQSAIDADPDKKKLQQDCISNMSAVAEMFEDKVTNGLKRMTRADFSGFLRDVQSHFIPREEVALRGM